MQNIYTSLWINLGTYNYKIVIYLLWYQIHEILSLVFLVDVFLGLLLCNFGFWGEKIKTVQIINNLSLDIKWRLVTHHECFACHD